MNELSEKEIFWIDFHGSFGPNGYNMNPGGLGGNLFQYLSDKQKAVRAQNIVRKWRKWWNNLPTDEQIKRINQMKDGNRTWYQNLTDEEKKKRSEHRTKGYYEWYFSLTEEELEAFGRKISQNIDSEKRSQANKERWASYTSEKRQEVLNNISNGIKFYYENLPDKEKEKMSKDRSEAYQNLTPEEKEERKRKNSQGLQNYWSDLSHEERVERGQKVSKGSKNYWSNLSPEERAERGRKISEGIRKKRAAQTAL